MTESRASASPAPSRNDDFNVRDAFRRAPRGVRWSAYVAAALALLLVLLVLAAGAFVRRPLPGIDGELELAGLDASVEVLRDEHGIAQIYADTDADLLRAQGFVAAQDRFFEMDVRRHVTSGRLAELFGEDGLETDKYIRTMGWRRVAEQEWALLDAETRDALTAYAEGVNAYIADRSTSELALEYTILGLSGLDYEPEPWEPADSLAWLKAMAWDLRGNMDDEIARVMATLDHTPEEIAQLYPAYDAEAHPPIVDGGGVVDEVFEQNATANSTRNPRRAAFNDETVRALADLQAGLRRLPQLLGRGAGIGSNSWVVDGEHSSTGRPLLANDPHLGVSQPGIWLQMGLHCREVTPDCTLQTTGFTFAGVPGVIIGHNADIAWGFTNLGPDVTDLYLERIEGRTWIQDGEPRPLEQRTETIEVRDGDAFELRIRETAHGPLLSDVSQELSTVGANAPTDRPGQRGNGYAVALQWTALEPSTTADAILALNRAGDWDEFRAAASDFAVPAQNLVYADREGHIGYQAPGLVPIRKSGNDGRMPAEGWLSANDWTGDHIPFDALPNVLDPDEGVIVTANQAVIGDDYPYQLTDDWDRGYRSTRISELLEREGELSIAEMTRVQLDTANPMAPTLVPYLLDVEELGSQYYRDGQELLADWDFTQPADSPAAAYYNAVWSNLLRLTFHDELREGIWPDGGDRWFAVVTDLLDDPVGPWWDDEATEDVVESRDDILRQAMLDARDELTTRQALDPQEWSWGHLHHLDLRHATLGESGIAPIERLFNRNGHEVGGGASIVDATSWDAAQGYEVTAAPSMRMVVSLADFDDSRYINLTGVSGHPGSSHYGDQTELFVNGEYLPWAFSRDAVVEAGENTLVLVPAEDD
ncbi:penicillin acylase family protein [Nocardioides piscis]|uniref:Penicillin acylase family protein n=1 Tax=Nocardioides piscis TaxID=2714938 RepID=A0A6G7YCN6_9ACTN|nr:penicillin acylase family protein [Nocardioides piscis]QIK74398.1 penicillin acylase family protein [Nocardioides piscis]